LPAKWVICVTPVPSACIAKISRLPVRSLSNAIFPLDPGNVARAAGAWTTKTAVATATDPITRIRLRKP
jgi:hypothetical protein